MILWGDSGRRKCPSPGCAALQQRASAGRISSQRQKKSSVSQNRRSLSAGKNEAGKRLQDLSDFAERQMGHARLFWER